MNTVSVRARYLAFRIKSQSRHSDRAVRTNRSAIPFCQGLDGLEKRRRVVEAASEQVVPLRGKTPYEQAKADASDRSSSKNK
jgi:hypothetical protein